MREVYFEFVLISSACPLSRFSSAGDRYQGSINLVTFVWPCVRLLGSLISALFSCTSNKHGKVSIHQCSAPSLPYPRPRVGHVSFVNVQPPASPVLDRVLPTFPSSMFSPQPPPFQTPCRPRVLRYTVIETCLHTYDLVYDASTKY